MSVVPTPHTRAADPETLLEAMARQLASGATSTIHLDHQAYSLAELDESARRLASHIVSIVPEGGRVGVMARNGRAVLLTWLATSIAERVLVPFNTGNRGAILEHQVADSGPSMMVVEEEFASIMDEALAATSMALPVLLDGEGALPSASSVEDFSTVLDRNEPLVTAGPPDRFALSHLVYTSGTTGPSKACMVSHAYLANLAKHMHENLQRVPGETLWTALPLFHLAAVGHTIGSLQLDSSISINRRFSVSGFWEDVVRSEAKVAALMGAMLPLILRSPENDWTTQGHGQLRVVSGAPVSADLAAAFAEKFGVDRVGSSAYGMTEATLIAASPAGAIRPGSAGIPGPDFEVKIVDAQGYDVPTGEPGEVVCRPTKPGIMFDGYWNQPEKTLEVYRGLWFHTGDVGRFDEDGYLFFVDRQKDYMRRGGENISSSEIENIALGHPEILEVAVHAVPSPLNEDDVKVTTVLKAGSELTEEQLFEYLLTRVPRYAVPSHIEFRTVLPKNSVGRVLKHELRAEGITEGTYVTDWRNRL